MQYNQLSDTLGNIYEALPLGNLIGKDVNIVFVQFLFDRLGTRHLDYDFGRKGAVERLQGAGAGQSLHSGDCTGHKALAFAFGAYQHLGYQVALEVQFVEDFGGIGAGPDHPAVFGINKFLCDI